MSAQILSIAILIGRAFLATILIIAGAAKLADQRGFTLTVIGLGVTTRAGQFARQIALLIPVVELALGGWMLTGLAQTLADIVTLALMATFSAIIGFATLRAPNTECRCFGSLSESRFGRRLLLRSFGLTLIALLVLVFDSTALSVSATNWWVVVMLVAGYLVLALIAVHAAAVVQEMKERMSAA